MIHTINGVSTINPVPNTAIELYLVDSQIAFGDMVPWSDWNQPRAS